MENKFSNILTEDEQVVAVTNATNTYAFKRCFVTLMLTLFFAVLFTTLSLALPWRQVDTYWGPEMRGFPWIVAIIVPGVFLLVTLIIFVIAKFGENNYFVCLTNKRVLIRYGAFSNSFKQYSIENVSGNISISCNQSAFDRRNEKSCGLIVDIELLPVGHSRLTIWTAALNNGYEMAKQIEKVVKDNSKKKTKTKFVQN